MTVEVAFLISLVSVCFSIFSGIITLKRTEKKETAEDTAKQTTVIVKLENISHGISEIKQEMKSVKVDVQNLRERLIVVEQSVKSAHHRLDGLTPDGKEV